MKSEFALKPASVFSRSAAGYRSVAAPRLAIALSPLRGWLSRRTLDTSTSGTRGGSTSLTTPSARSCLLFKEGNQ
jgi:hypothetical protein